MTQHIGLHTGVNNARSLLSRRLVLYNVGHVISQSVAENCIFIAKRGDLRKSETDGNQREKKNREGCGDMTDLN